jgi:hypothetical protein
MHEQFRACEWIMFCSAERYRPSYGLLRDHKWFEEPRKTSRDAPGRLARSGCSEAGLRRSIQLTLVLATSLKGPRPLGYNYPVRALLVLWSLSFAQAWVTYQPLCCPSRPADGRSYLAFLYPEYFCAAHWTDTLGSRSAILEHNPSWAAHFPLLPTLHAVSCCHRALLVFLLLLYCYYKSNPLSIPLELLQRRLQDSDGLGASRQAVDFLVVGDGYYSS